MTDPAGDDWDDDDEVEVIGAPEPVPPYAFDPGDVEESLELLDALGAEIEDHWTAIDRLTSLAKDRGIEQSPLVRELVHALGHSLVREVDGKAGCALGREESHHELLGWPRPISDTPAPALELWRGIAAIATDPKVVARFEDLLFTRRDGNGQERASRAANAYLAALDATGGDPAELDLRCTDLLLRAWTLARAVRETFIDADVRGRMALIAPAMLAAHPGDRPGAVLPLLRALAAGPIDRGPDPHDVDEMLARAANDFRRGYLGSQIAADRRGRAKGDAATLEAIARDEVASYFAQADDAAQPAVRMHFLEEAARIATNRGLGDLAQDAAAQMQRIRPSELGFKSFYVESSIPAWLPESMLEPFTHGSSWHEGLSFFLTLGDPPSGSLEQIKKTAKSSRGVIRDLMATTMFGAGGLPRATTNSAADREAEGMHHAAGMSAAFYGSIFSTGLGRMAALYGTPQLDDVVAALMDMGCRDPQLARGLAKGLIFYWGGDYESSVAVALPKFEAAARSLLRELDEGIYRVQLGNDPGGYVTLYPLLDELERLALDPSWAYFFRWLLLGPYGMNLRNDVAHGFIFDPGPIYAALTLRAVAVLVMVAGTLPNVSLDSDDEESSTDAALDDDGTTPARDREQVLADLAHPTPAVPIQWRLASHLGRAFEKLGWWIRARSALAARRRP